MLNLTAKEYRALLKGAGPKASKYKAVRTKVGTLTFASKREANRYAKLALLQDAGVIRRLTLQPNFPISINGTKVFTYIADFAYELEGKMVFEDAKGVRTPVYHLKKKCVEAQYGIKIVEV